MPRRRRALVAVVAFIAACTGATPASATSQERATCGAVHLMGQVLDSLLSGDVPPGDGETLQRLVDSSEEVRASASMASNRSLERYSERLAEAAGGLTDAPSGDASFERSPQALVVALRSLVDECAEIGASSAEPAPTAPVLRVGDLPGTWAAAPHDPRTASYARLAVRFQRCVGEGFTLPWGPMESSNDFTREHGAQQVRSAAMRISPEDAAALVAQTDSERAPACMTEVMRASLAQTQARFTVLDVRSESVPDDDPDIATIRTTLTLDLGGAVVPVYLDLVVLAEGAWAARMQLIGTGVPLADGPAIVEVFQSRLAAAGDTG